MFHDEAAFRRALRVDPWSEAQRLIYADWLEEQGCTAQAEYLRLEQTLATMAPGTVGHFATEARFQGLRRELPTAWLRAVQVPYALVLEEPLPAARSIIAAVGTAGRFSPSEVQRRAQEIPCVLADNLSRQEAELRRQSLDGDRRLPRHGATRLPRVSLRPMASLRFALRLERMPDRRGNKSLKLVQELTGLGFKKAVALHASTPCMLKYDLNQPDAQKWQTKLTAMGCLATLRLQARPAMTLPLCRVTLQSFDPRFRQELEERLLPYCFYVRRGYDYGYGYDDPLGKLPLVLKKCVWQEEAEEIRQRLVHTAFGHQLAQVVSTTF